VLVGSSAFPASFHHKNLQLNFKDLQSFEELKPN